MTRSIYIVVVLLASVLFVSCNSISSASYEEHAIYYNGKPMSGVKDNRFTTILGSDSGGFGGMFGRDNNDIQAAWQQHKSSAKKMPREFTLEIYPPAGWIPETIHAVDSSNREATCTMLKDKEVEDKVIGQVRITLHRDGGYVILDLHRPGTYILIQH